MNRRALCVGAALSAVGCNGGSPTHADLGSGVDLALPPGDFAGACNTLSFASAPMVTIGTNLANAPTFSGGSVSDGVYYLEQETLYNAGAGNLGGDQFVLVLSSGTLNFASMTLGTVSATYTTSGASFDLVDRCPDTATLSFQYTAAGSTLQLGQVHPSSTIVREFVKQ